MPYESDLRRRRTAIAIWLFGVAAMVFVMIVIGGLTRLTDSGLSMVHWRPITGWLPPLTAAEWEAVFAAYRQSPEYQKVNAGMTLEAFRGIFWLEYIHRLWGRLIGVAFALPLAVFLARGWIERALAPKLIGLFVLGALQGVLGWYMVKSGLIDRPDVSQYRLAAHLVLALIIYAALLWVGFALLRERPPAADAAAPRRHAAALVALVLITATSGAFVAGLDAGYGYNTFPLMDGQLIPEHILAGSPWWLSFFEDRTTVQFTHRVLALTTLGVALALWWRARRATDPLARGAAGAVAAAAVLQVALGIATLLLIVPLPLAAAHQAGGVVLLTAAVWAAFEMRRPAAVPVSSPAASAVGGRAFTGE